MIPVIIQARLGSKRLPGKVLMPIKGRPMIRMMVDRLEASRTGTIIMVSVPSHDYVPIYQALEDTNAIVYAYPGPEDDVAARFRHVLMNGMCYVLQPKFFVRLCADSPLLDPALLDWMIRRYDGQMLTNTQPRSWPGGQCVEIIPVRDFMEEGFSGSWSLEDKEHVTPWLYRNKPFTNVTNPDGDWSHKSMVVDTEEDYQRIRSLVENLGAPLYSYGWKELAEMMP